MSKPLRRLLCRMGRHRQLHVIQTFGAAQHVGCPDCRRQFAMHHDLRAFLPWDSSFAALYQCMGYETDQPTKAWLAHLSAKVQP